MNMYQNFSEAYRGNTGLGYSASSAYPPPTYPLPPAGGSGTSLSSSSQYSGVGGNILSRMNETSAVELLQHLNKMELHNLHENDSKLKDLIDDLPQVKAVQSEHDNMIATNKSLAEYNLSLRPQLEELKHEVAHKYELANSLKTNLAESKANLDSLMNHQSLETLLALLQTETAKCEEESEQLADEFCSGRLGVEDFLNDYVPKRTQTHVRRIKSERFAELVRDSQTSNNSWAVPSSQPVTSSYPQAPAPYPRGPAPYPPSSALGMPQPSYYPR